MARKQRIAGTYCLNVEASQVHRFIPVISACSRTACKRVFGIPNSDPETLEDPRMTPFPESSKVRFHAGRFCLIYLMVFLFYENALVSDV